MVELDKCRVEEKLLKVVLLEKISGLREFDGHRRELVILRLWVRAQVESRRAAGVKQLLNLSQRSLLNEFARCGNP